MFVPTPLQKLRMMIVAAQIVEGLAGRIKDVKNKLSFISHTPNNLLNQIRLQQKACELESRMLEVIKCAAIAKDIDNWIPLHDVIHEECEV